MYRIAAVITGEYRTFPICRKTMTFLDLNNVDIYFSTWNFTEWKIPTKDLKKKTYIKKDHIEAVVGKSAIIDIEDGNSIIEKKYNTKMIYKWKRGIELVKNSNVVYDYIIMLRPDIFFSHITFNFNNLEKYKNKFGIGWWRFNPNSTKLADNLFLGSADVVFQVFDHLDIKMWEDSKIDCWHTWWNLHVRSKAEPTDLLGLDNYTFCRPFASHSDDFETILRKQHKWRDLTIIDQLKIMSREQVEENWPIDIIENAIKRYNSGELLDNK